ncbi:hypothetical protein [Brevundimonas diminuta]|uniref:hypothetical protein n=1 Tax=Brevundimonas diminuta TaxID=293 RepID=UPI0032091786
MSAISSERPAFPPQAGGAAHALRTAQSAFFRQAMGVATPVAAQSSVEQAAAPKPSEASTASARLQRPGSLLDIRV